MIVTPQLQRHLMSSQQSISTSHPLSALAFVLERCGTELPDGCVAGVHFQISSRQQMERRSVIADPNDFFVGMGGDLEVIFEFLTDGDQHQIDSWIDLPIADALEPRSGAPIFI